MISYSGLVNRISEAYVQDMSKRTTYNPGAQKAYRDKKLKAGRVETLVRVEGKDADDLARLAERLDVSKPEVFRIALRQLADKKGNR